MEINVFGRADALNAHMPVSKRPEALLAAAEKLELLYKEYYRWGCPDTGLRALRHRIAEAKAPKPNSLAEQYREVITKMAAEGAVAKDIAAATGISKNAIMHWCRNNGYLLSQRPWSGGGRKGCSYEKKTAPEIFQQRCDIIRKCLRQGIVKSADIAVIVHMSPSNVRNYLRLYFKDKNGEFTNI